MCGYGWQFCFIICGKLSNKMNDRQKAGAVIAAAGNSQRMDGADKVFALLGGEPILVRVVDVFQGCNPIDQIVIVLRQPNLERGKQLVIEQGW